MITCTLGDKKYTVDFVPGRALREIQPAMEMYAKVHTIAKNAMNGVIDENEKVTVDAALDIMVHWFCLLFGNQFTPDELYDGYPADRLMADITLAMVAVYQQTTEVLSEFPTIPAAKQIPGESTGK